jgi:hypothetical protein
VSYVLWCKSAPYPRQKSELALCPIPSLKRLKAIVLFLAQSSLDGVIETARFKVGFMRVLSECGCWSNHTYSSSNSCGVNVLMARSISWTVFKPRGPLRYLPGGRQSSFGGSGVSIDGRPYYPNNLRIFSLRLLLIY